MDVGLKPQSDRRVLCLKTLSYDFGVAVCRRKSSHTYDIVVRLLISGNVSEISGMTHDRRAIVVRASYNRRTTSCRFKTFMIVHDRHRQLCERRTMLVRPSHDWGLLQCILPVL